jgi:hypothetical protein
VLLVIAVYVPVVGDRLPVLPHPHFITVEVLSKFVAVVQVGAPTLGAAAVVAFLLTEVEVPSAFLAFTQA